MAAPTPGTAVTVTGSGTAAAVADISAVAAGTGMVAVFTVGSPTDVGTLPPGWTLLLPVGIQQITGTRRTALAGRIKQAGDTSVSWNSSTSAYKRLTILPIPGAGPVSSWALGTIGVRAAGDVVSGQSVQAGSSTACVAPSMTAPVDALDLSIFVEATTAVGEPTISGATPLFNSGDTSPVIEQHTIAYSKPSAGATPAVTATYVPTQASNGMGVQLIVPAPSTGPIERTANLAFTVDISGTASVARRPGFASVRQMLATPGATWAHRGGSTNWQEMSEYAFDQAVLAGYGALEFSAHRTSDGVWIGSHDASLNRTSQTTGLPNISAMTWAQVQTYMNTVNPADGARPYYRLDEFLDKYTPTHVCIVDPKNDVSRIAEFLAICDAHGGKDKIVVKFYGVGSGSTALADAAKAKQYETWGYFYEADYLNGTMARDQGHWSILGMNYDASQVAWDAALSYGKPVVGHIAASQANYNTAIAKGARMVQCANVAGITAVGASTLAADIPIAVSLSATRTVDVARTATLGFGIELGTSRTIETERTASVEADVELSATRTVGVTRAADLQVDVGMSGTLGSGSIVRTANIAIDVGLSSTRSIDMERAGVIAVNVSIGAQRTVGASRTADLEVSVSVHAMLSSAPAVPFPERRTLEGVDVEHTLTALQHLRTLEDA